MNEQLVLAEPDGAVNGGHREDLARMPVVEGICRRMFRDVPGMPEPTPRPNPIAATAVPTFRGSSAGRRRRRGPGNAADAGKITRFVLVRAPDGGQLRTVISDSRTVSTMAYPSRRYGCIRYGEAETECARISEEELCPVTVEAVSQPLRVEADATVAASSP